MSNHERSLEELKSEYFGKPLTFEEFKNNSTEAMESLSESVGSYAWEAKDIALHNAHCEHLSLDNFIPEKDEEAPTVSRGTEAAYSLGDADPHLTTPDFVKEETTLAMAEQPPADLLPANPSPAALSSSATDIALLDSAMNEASSDATFVAAPLSDALLADTHLVDASLANAAMVATAPAEVSHAALSAGMMTEASAEPSAETSAASSAESSDEGTAADTSEYLTEKAQSSTDNCPLLKGLE